LTRYGKMIMNFSSGQRSSEICEYHEIIVTVPDTEKVHPAAVVIQTLLERYYEKKDWEIRVPLDRLETLSRMKWLFGVLGVAIAAISMQVGGIGIMNIMLSSITERTREIGIRRALGARKKDIIRQFLTETVMLSSAGGLAGIPAGAGLAATIPWLIRKGAVSMGVGGEAALMQLSQVIVTPLSMGIALTTSILVGIASGLYPAYRAANMDPIQALHHD